MISEPGVCDGVDFGGEAVDQVDGPGECMNYDGLTIAVPSTQNYSFTSVEQLDDVQHDLGWLTEYRQLKPGPFHSAFSILENGTWFLLEEKSSCQLELLSPTFPGMVVLLVLEGKPGIVNGQEFSKDHLMVFPPGCDFRAAMPAGIRVTQLGVPVEEFERVCRAVSPQLCLLDEGIRSIPLTPGKLAGLAASMRVLLMSPPDCIETRDEWASAILTQTLSLACHCHATPQRDSMPRVAARRAMNRAIEYIEVHLDEAISVATLGDKVGATTRSLERTFARELGVSPQQYVKARRLNAVHRCLLNNGSEENVRIIDVATRFGFSHMGRFAGEYHRYFGECPRDTLLGSQLDPPSEKARLSRSG